MSQQDSGVQPATNKQTPSSGRQTTTTGKSSTHMGVPDFVLTGVFTALYFVLLCVATGICALAISSVSSLFSPALAALLCASVYMLLAARVQKFGAISIMGCVIGLFFLVIGHFPLSFLPFIICALAADLIAYLGHYQSKIGLLISYVVFSFGNTGPSLPLWFMKDAYIKRLNDRGKSQAYITDVFANINMTTFAISMVTILVCAIVGGLFGQWMMRKHFKKAGII